MVTILHTADWHLGRDFHHYPLEEAFAVWARWVIDTVREENVDVVLISGDVYDRALPPNDAVTLLDATLTELAQLTTVVVTTGNHDSRERLVFLSKLLNNRLHIQAGIEGIKAPIRVPVGERTVEIVPLPYLQPLVDAPYLARVCDREVERRQSDLMAATLDHLEASGVMSEHDPSTLRILMAHGYVVASSPDAGEESDDPEDVGGLDAIPSRVFNGRRTDYVALGHIHRPYTVDRHMTNDAGVPVPIVYCGSPIAFSFSEARFTKKATLVRWDESGQLEVEMRPVPVVRPVVTLRGTLEEVLEHREHADSFVRVELLDTSVPPNLRARLDQVFSRVCEIKLPSVQRDAMTINTRDYVDPFDVIRRFFTDAKGEDLSDTQADTLRELWDEFTEAHR